MYSFYLIIAFMILISVPDQTMLAYVETDEPIHFFIIIFLYYICITIYMTILIFYHDTIFTRIMGHFILLANYYLDKLLKIIDPRRKIFFF